MTANHGFYGTRTPKEFSIVGSASGFDWTTVTDGFLAGDIVESVIKMESLGGDDWRFQILQNGIGEQTVDFTHDFSTGLHDIEIEFAINDNVKQVVTIMDYDDTRPADFLWFPNRAPEDSIRLVYNTFVLSPVRFNGKRTTHTALLTHSTDASYAYWNGTLNGDTISIRADKQTGLVSYSYALSSGTPSTFYLPILYIASPFHVSFFYKVQDSSFGNNWDGFAYNEDDPPLIERFQFSELFDDDLSATTYRSDLMVKDFSTMNSFRRGMLQIGELYLSGESGSWIIDPAPINSALSALGVSNSVIRQEVGVMPVHDGVTVRFRMYLNPSPFAGNVGTFNKTFSIDGDGRFSGDLRFRVFKNSIEFTDVDITIAGRCVSNNLPTDFWPDTDEEYSQLEQTKLWLPEFFSKGREHDDPAFNWMLTKNVSTQLIGKPAFTHQRSPVFDSGGTFPAVPVVIEVASGALPTGMTVSSNLSTSTSELRVSGTPTTDEDGQVQFRIRSEISFGSGTSTAGTIQQKDYLSKVYTWIVGTGTPVTFTIEYPSPFTNTMTPPSSGFDWRIDGATAVLTPYSIPATVTGGTGPFTFSLLSGTLPPYATLNTSTGAISTTGINPLDPSITGSCVIRVVDSLSAQADSITYDWQYIG